MRYPITRIVCIFLLIGYLVCGLCLATSQASTKETQSIRGYLQNTLPPDQHHRIGQLSTLLLRVSMESGVSLEVLAAIVTVESSWDSSARSKKGALGLTQVMPGVWGKSLKKAGIIRHSKDLLKPYQSLRAGSYVYAHYKDKFKKHKNPRRSALLGYTNRNRAAYALMQEEMKIFKGKERAA